MSINIVKLSEILCRTCMGEVKDKRKISMFNRTDRVEDSITIMELLMSTVPELNISISDNLPKELCEYCLERLINAYEFQKMCIKVEKRLKEILTEQPTLNDKVKAQLEKECMEVKTEDNQWSSDNSVQFEDDISSEDIELALHTIKISKAIKPSKAMQRKAKIASDIEQNLDKICNTAFKICKENKKDCNENNNMDEENKNFLCDECGSHLKTIKTLKKHKKIHLKPPVEGAKINQELTKYECKICRKVFQQSRLLKQHERIHTDEQKHVCSECGKVFNNLRYMQQHLLRHSTVNLYECPYCPKRFRCKNDLSAHKAVHKKKKTHICDVCGSGFTIPYLLKRHKRYHTGERNYKCNFCEMSFFTGYQCRRHMRTHTGERPFKCKYCERAFAQSNDLIKHLRVHLGDNIYKCELCPQGYRLLRDLRVHFKSHKNDDEETKARNLKALKDEEQRLSRNGQKTENE